MTRENQRTGDGRYVGKTRVPPVGNDIAYIILEMERSGSDVGIDLQFATPAEAYFMISMAYEKFIEKG